MTGTLDADLSERVARVVHPRNKRCFSNAVRALSAALDSPDLKDDLQGAFYCEGFADGLPHGWVETADGRIVDVTPTWRKQKETRYLAVQKYAPADLVGVRELPILDLDRTRVSGLEGAAGEE